MKPKRIKICITGGHLAPALAVIEEISRQRLPWDIVFVGRTYDFEGSGQISHEKEIITSRGIRFIGLTAGRLQRSLSPYTVRSLLKFPVGFFQSLNICAREKPDAVVSFGGYVALPVVLAAGIFGIPVLTHEQTRVSGLANRIIARIARKICISFPETNHRFPVQKTVITGLPIRKEIISGHIERPFEADLNTHPLLYITGGTTGSESLNNLLFPQISAITRDFTVIHQTGKLSYRKAADLKAKLPESQRIRYIPEAYIGEQTVGWILRNARLVLGRSGANTVMELAILGRRAILVPLPWSGGNEQYQNARWLEKLHLAVVVEQKEATGPMLSDLAMRMMREKQRPVVVPQQILNGAGNVVSEIEHILRKS